MPDTGWIYFTSATQVDKGGGNAWNNIDKALVEDATNAYTAILAAQNTDYLRLWQLIASSALGSSLITGIIASMKIAVGGAGKDATFYAQLLNGGALVGNEKNTGLIEDLGTFTFYELGASDDLWGLTGLTINDLLQTDFGISLWCDTVSGGDVAFDVVRLKIYYEPRLAFFI